LTEATVVDVKTQPVWHGTSEQAVELANALAHNCACEFGALGDRVVTCAAHTIIEDQRLLDGLAFARYMAQRLVEQEHDSST
jgi:hypothetical protein